MESPRPPKPKPDAAEPTIFQWRLEQWFPQLGASEHEKLKRYNDELIKFNKTVNLVGLKTLPLADVIHFADSILATQMIAKTGSIPEIYDFGSGNGFPGIVYAALQKSTKVVLVEVDGRKAEFIKHIATVLALSNVQVKIQTIESLPEKSVPMAMSRGFANITKALISARKIMKKGGIYYHLKSEEWATEVAQIPTQLCSFWAPSLLGNYRLPVGEVNFAIVKTEKISD